MRTGILALALSGLAGCGVESPADPNFSEAADLTMDGEPLPSSYRPTEGPFGISKAAAIADLDATPVDENAGLFEVDRFPKPHPDFANLGVIASPATGVCEVLASGREIDDDVPGTIVRSIVDRVAAQLELRYGKPRKVDWCDTTTTNCRPGFWVIDLQNAARGYGYSWQATAARPLPNDLAKIELFVISTPTHDAYPQLNYTFDNAPACAAALDKAASAAL